MRTPLFGEPDHTCIDLMICNEEKVSELSQGSDRKPKTQAHAMPSSVLIRKAKAGELAVTDHVPKDAEAGAPRNVCPISALVVRLVANCPRPIFCPEFHCATGLAAKPERETRGSGAASLNF
jgi:hypothetical protein